MIYLISHENNYLKIGHTNDIHKRFSQIQVSSPIKLDLLYLIDGNASKEKEIHNLFKDFRTNGEWFYFDESILNFFKNENCLMWSQGFLKCDKKEIIGLVKSERLKNKMSLNELGELYGVTPQSMHEIELREARGAVTINVLHKVAKIFNKKLEYRFV